jgi:hypothetical protein
VQRYPPRNGWDPMVEAIIAQEKATFRWGLYDREPLTTWTRGRLSLLGDAALPMLPHVGQGAIQAIGVAVALATVSSHADWAAVSRACCFTNHCGASELLACSAARALTALPMMQPAATCVSATGSSLPSHRNAPGSGPTTPKRERRQLLPHSDRRAFPVCANGPAWSESHG